MKAVLLLLVCVAAATAIDNAIDIENATALDDAIAIDLAAIDANATAEQHISTAEQGNARRSLISTDGMLCSIEGADVLTCYAIADLATVQFDEDAECSTAGAITKCVRSLSLD